MLYPSASLFALSAARICINLKNGIDEYKKSRVSSDEKDEGSFKANEDLSSFKRGCEGVALK
jgi:hypothetical protein